MAIHECAHAVARILVADDWGLRPDEIVQAIIVCGRASRRVGSLEWSAHVQGPTFTRAIELALENRIPHITKGVGDLNAMWAAMRNCISIDLSPWAQDRAFINMCGAVAQARFLHLRPAAVWTAFHCLDDHHGVWDAYFLAGLPDAQAVRDIFAGAAFSRAQSAIQQPKTWAAIEALASALPENGVLTGQEIAAIVTPFYSGSRSGFYPGFCNVNSCQR
jgi:hypothetical protein